ncbi:MAG TPA: hypothetical protein VLE02_01985 [Nitrosarchaeum sp.]|nr:hypothetical protein [Nitrosarchaeum sp.]
MKPIMTAKSILKLSKSHIKDIKFFLQINDDSDEVCIGQYVQIWNSGACDKLVQQVKKKRQEERKKCGIHLINEDTIPANNCHLLSDNQLFLLQKSPGDKNYQALEYKEVEDYVKTGKDYYRTALTKPQLSSMKKWLREYKHKHLQTLELGDAIKYVFEVYIPLACKVRNPHRLLEKLSSLLPVIKSDNVVNKLLTLDGVHLNYILLHFGVDKQYNSLYEQRLRVIELLLEKTKIQTRFNYYNIVQMLYDVVDMQTNNWTFRELGFERQESHQPRFLDLHDEDDPFNISQVDPQVVDLGTDADAFLALLDALQYFSTNFGTNF